MSLPSPPPEETRARTHWGYLVAAFSCLCFMGFGDNMRGPVFPALLADLGLDDAQGGLMFAATSVGAMAGGQFFRRLVRLTSTLRSTQLGLFLGAVGLFGTTLATDLPGLLVAAFVFGIACGGLALSQNLMVEEGSRPVHRRQWLSGLHSVYGLASLVAPLVVNALANAGADWRVSLQLAAALLVGLTLCLMGVKPLPPRTPVGTQAPPRPAGLGVRQWAVCLMVSFAVTAELTISTRLVQLLQREGLPDDQAAWALAAFFVCLLLGRLACSLWRTRLSSRALILSSGLLSLALFIGGLQIEFLLLPVVALTLGPFFPVAIDMIADEFGPHLEETLGLMVVVVSLALAVAHIALGVWSDAASLAQAFWLGPMALLGALLCLWWSRPEARIDPAQAA